MSLIPTNQVRADGNIVYDVPNNFKQVRSLHGTYIPEAGLTINFELRSMMPHYPTRISTEEEITSCCHLMMKSEE